MASHPTFGELAIQRPQSVKTYPPPVVFNSTVYNMEETEQISREVLQSIHNCREKGFVPGARVLHVRDKDQPLPNIVGVIMFYHLKISGAWRDYHPLCVQFYNRSYPTTNWRAPMNPEELVIYDGRGES